MGLDLNCGDENLRCGYYYVQKFRKYMISITIKYLEHLGSNPIEDPKWNDYLYDTPANVEDDKEFNEERTNQLITKLNECITDTGTIFPINYQIFNQINQDLFSFFGLMGLKWIVDHSDSEGYYTPGQCLDMINLIARIEAHLIFANEMDKIWFQDLLKMFFKSYNERKNILCQ